MRRPRFWGAALVSLAAASLSTQTFAECVLGMTTAMPLRSAGKRFVVTTTINGHDSDLILDTGSFATVIDYDATTHLGLTPGLYPGQVYGIGGTQQLYKAQAASMRIGRMKADGTTLAVHKFGGLDKNAAIDGVFGMNMMSHYDIDLDIVGQKAVLYEAEGRCGKPTVTLGPTLYAVPLEDVRRDQEAVVTVSVEGHRLRALLDTGASSSVMFRRAAMRLGVDLSALHDSGNLKVRGVGDLAVPAMQHVFKTVDIGDLRVQNMPIAILAQRDTGIDHHHTGSLLENAEGDETGNEDMLLGADFMRMVHLWISHSSHTLIMQFPPEASPPLPVH